MGTLSLRHGAYSGCGWWRRPPDEGGVVAANVLNKKFPAVDKVCSSSLGFGRGANNYSQ